MTSINPVEAPATASTGARMVERQDRPDMLDVLRAKSAAYDAAQRWYSAEVGFTVAAPLILAACNIAFPQMTNAVLVYNALAAATYLLVLHRLQRKRGALGATLQEWFDCTVFDLAWRGDRAGPTPAPETIRRWAHRHPAATGLRHWYPRIVERLPLPAAVIVCHRANGTWSMTVRERYARALRLAACAIVLVIVVIAMIRSTTVIDTFRWGGTVSAPLLWLYSESWRQDSVASDAEGARRCADGLWQRMLQGQPAGAFAPEIRELQNDVFSLRKRAPQLLPWAYRAFRDQDEREMNAIAVTLVEEYLAATPPS